MPWQNVPGRNGLLRWPYQHAGTVAAGGYYTYGAGGDVDPGSRGGGDPGNCVINPIVYNAGTVPCFVGADIIAMMLKDEAFVIPASAPPQRLQGVFASLVVYDQVGGAAAVWSLSSELDRRLNTPGDVGHPGHAPEHSGFVTAVPGGTASLIITAAWSMGTTGIWLWAPGTPTSAAGDYDLKVYKNGTENMLSASDFDLETLSAGVPKKDIALTATPADLLLEPGDTIEIDAISTNGDLLNGDFAVLIVADKL